MLIGNVAIYLVGVPWLAVALGVDLPTAIALGLTPFIVIDAIKLLPPPARSAASWWVGRAADRRALTRDAVPRRRRSACTGPTARPGASTARRCCCWVRGRGRCCCSSPIPASRPASTSTATSGSDPWARLQATLRSYLTIVYGTTTAARAEIRRLNELHRSIRGRRLRRPRPRPLALGPRDARRDDDRRLRRLDRAAAARRARALLRRDAADRAGLRGPGRPASRRPRVVRGVRRVDARARRARPSLVGRPRARLARPEPAAGAGAAAARRPAARRRTRGRCGRRSRCCPRPCDPSTASAGDRSSGS